MLTLLTKQIVKILIYSILLLTIVPLYGQDAQKSYENMVRQMGNKNWKQATLSVDSLLLSDAKNNYWLISKAEIEARKGNISIANQFLAKAVGNGYWYLEELIHDEHLTNLRGTREYKQTTSTLEQKLSQYKLSDKDQQITIEVPPLMECYVVMLYLGNSKHTLINDKQSHAYFKKIDEYFMPYKDHRLVKVLAQRYPSKDSEWINNLRAHHNLRTFYPYDTLNIKAIKRFPIELDDELAALVRDFAVATNFMKFYNDNSEFYDAMTTIMLTNYSFGSNVIPFFNSNFDMRINRFNVYFSPIYGGWQHGPVAKVSNYIECFYFGGIMYSNTKEFYYPDVNLLFTFLTEFDHTPINALTEKYKDQIGTFKDKVKILNTSGNVSYGSMISTLEEYITWAFALQYFYEHTPTEYQKLETNIVYVMEKHRGFSKFGEFMKHYKICSGNRQKYPTLNDFYPEIISWLQKL